MDCLFRERLRALLVDTELIHHSEGPPNGFHMVKMLCKSY